MERKTLSPVILQKRIRGVFFNEKSTEASLANIYPGIEIADLFSYPLHCFARYGEPRKDFAIVEKKLSNYPDYYSYGFLMFPEEWLEKHLETRKK